MRADRGIGDLGNLVAEARLRAGAEALSGCLGLFGGVVVRVPGAVWPCGADARGVAVPCVASALGDVLVIPGPPGQFGVAFGFDRPSPRFGIIDDPHYDMGAKRVVDGEVGVDIPLLPVPYVCAWRRGAISVIWSRRSTIGTASGFRP